MAEIKVNGVGVGRRTTSSRKSKKVDGTSSESFSQTLKDAAETARTGVSAGVTGVASTNSIISIQEISGSMDERSKGLMLTYGDDLLDRLEELRLCLLDGVIPKDDLAELAHRMREKKQSSDDPVLTEIIEEIELRAEVEIAKLTRKT